MYTIDAKGLSKRFKLGELHSSHRYPTLRDAIAQTFKGFFGRRKNLAPVPELWALNDVSFQVKPGEVVGIIGRNGAGKSTLLKILSRITAPTKGTVTVKGRVSSLLEVGSGFHPELTGRENIFLNGAILGMPRAEIRKKFDAIVEFAEVPRFVDTPVKHYSSGMYLRLAFAVAAHLDPDILIVDEVLSVGDTGFQRKCLGKMQGVASENRTVLVVTHHLESVRSLCTRAILLKAGQVEMDGAPEHVLSQYLRSVTGGRNFGSEALANRLHRGRGTVRFTSMRAVDEKGQERWMYESGEPVTLKLSYQAYADAPSLAACFSILSPVTGEVITSVKETISDKPLKEGESGTINFVFPALQLRPGDYSLYLSLGEKDYDRVYDIIDHNVDLPLLSVTSKDEDPYKRMGYFFMPSTVEVEKR